MNAAPASVLIAICTYRRPGIADTLASLARLRPCGLPVRIAIADNDVEPSARAQIDQIAATHPLAITYIHAPAGNISIARNALLDHARSTGIRLIAWIDDDEIADPDWLVSLVGVWQDCATGQGQAPGVGAVLGPVLARYLPDAPAWMHRVRPHDTSPVVRDGTITSGYAGNLLLDLGDPAVGGLCFDLARGRTGGEDSAFFAAYVQAGGRIGFAKDACVSETVTPNRVRLGWLLRRRYRMGQTHASLIASGQGPLKRLSPAGLAGSKALACTGLALLGAARADRRNPQLMRAALHLGAIAHLAGARRMKLYGQAADTPALGRTDHLEEQ